MAERTLTVKTGGGSSYSTGWHTKLISKAEYGDYNGTKYLDVWFEDFPESLNMRVYEKKNSSGEEFAIGNLFRYANAGITSALEGANNTKVIKLDDSPQALIGKSLNVYVHKDGKTILIPKRKHNEYLAKGWKTSSLRAETQTYESKLVDKLNQRLK